MLPGTLRHLVAPRPFLTDGGLETDLIFHRGIDLPAFAAFVLLDADGGREQLRAYYRPYLDLARRHATGMVLEAPTWRANTDWGRGLGYGPRALARVNRDAVGLLRSLARETPSVETVVSGCVGPRGDGYVVGEQMTVPQAAAYHLPQVSAFAEAGADLVSALTIPYVDEAVGIARAAQSVDLPSVISFTVETDGRLPSGQALADAVRQTDAATGAAPAYYMVNCAHPTHFEPVLDGGDWTRRLRGVRANASTCSHAELDRAEALDDGDPTDLASRYARLAERLDLAVVGGCCGTDLSHVAAIAERLVGARAAA